MSTFSEVVVMDAGPPLLSKRRAAAVNMTFFLIAVLSTVALRAPLWLVGVLVYCCVRRTALLGLRLFPSRLWVLVLAALGATTACSVIANTAGWIASGSSAVRLVAWSTMTPLWVLLGVQQWRSTDLVNTVVAPVVATSVLGVYTLVLRRTLANHVLARDGDGGARPAPGRSAVRQLLSRWANAVFAACRLAAAPLVALLCWAVAWIAAPSAVGFCLEVAAFCFAAVILGIEHAIRRNGHQQHHSGGAEFDRLLRAERRVTDVFGGVVAAVLLVVCLSQSAAVAFFLQEGSSGGGDEDGRRDWARQLGLEPAALNTADGLRALLQVLGMASVFVAAAAMQRGVASSASSSALPAHANDGLGGAGSASTSASSAASSRANSETARLLTLNGQPVLLLPSPVVAPPLGTGDDATAAERHRRTPQVFAILGITLLLAYAVYYPSLVSAAVWLLHLCCCAGTVAQHPQAPSAALRVALAGVLAVLTGCILVQHACLVLLVNPRTAALASWLPSAQPAYPDDARAVAAQVCVEHLIAITCGVYVSVAGVAGAARASSEDEEGEGEAAADSSSATTRTRSPPSLAALMAAANQAARAAAPPAEPPAVAWLRAQLRGAGADRERLHQLFEVAVGRSPRTVELEALCAAAATDLRRGQEGTAAPSPIASRGGLTVEEVAQYIASAPCYTYMVILCTFALGTSGASMDLLHATCLVLSLAVSVVGSTAVLYRRLRKVPPVWVALLVGVQLCYSVFAKHDGEDTTTTVRVPATRRRSLAFFGTDDYIGLSAFGWADCVPYLYAQLVLMWCSRYEPTWLTDWTAVAQCLVYRCRWARLGHAVHRVAGAVVLAWMVLLLPRCASVSLLVLLLFAAALLQHLRWHRLAYLWRRFLLVWYCGLVLMAMLTAEFAPVRPLLWRLLRGLGCPAGSESRCAEDLGLPANSATWLTPLAIPSWVVIVLATVVASPYPLPSTLVGAPDAAVDAGASQGSAWTWRRFFAWWPQVLADGLQLTLLAAMAGAALQRPSVLTALYLLGAGLGLAPSWTLSGAATHATLQVTYQFWFAPDWLDTPLSIGVTPAVVIGLWRPSSPTTLASRHTAAVLADHRRASSLSSASSCGDASSLPSTMALAAAPLLLGAVQALQLQCAQLARWRARNTPAAVAEPARVWSAVQRTTATHLYVPLLLVLLSLSQRVALGSGAAGLVAVTWFAADVRECGVLLRSRLLFRCCTGATAALLMSSYVLYSLHTILPSLPALQQHPWLLGGALRDGVPASTRLSTSSAPRSATTATIITVPSTDQPASGDAAAAEVGAALSNVCWVLTAACAVLRLSSDAPRDSESDRLLSHPHGPSFITWLRRRMGALQRLQQRGAPDRLAASLSRMPSAQAEDFLLTVATEVVGCEAAAADVETENATAALLQRSPAGVAGGAHVDRGLVVNVARLVPLVACGSMAVGAAQTSPPCALSVVLLLAGFGLAVRHVRLQWNFFRWWRPAAALYALLPLLSLAAWCPVVRDALPGLPPWVGLFVGLSPDATRVEGAALVFSRWHVVLFVLLWAQHCVYNCPAWGAALLREQEEERRRGEQRHAALQRKWRRHVTRATETAARVDRDIRAYLDALRAGDDTAGESLTRRRESGGHGASDETGEDEGEGGVVTAHVVGQPGRGGREALPTPPALPLGSPTTEVDDEAEVDDERGETGSGAASGRLPSHAPALRSDGREVGVEASGHEPSAPSSASALWWRQRCAGWLRQLCNALAAYTYHPAEHRCGGPVRRSGRAAAAIDAATIASATDTLWRLSWHALRTAAHVALRHTPLALLVCTLCNTLLTGCLWELLGLCYVVLIALTYHPHAPRVVYQVFGLYLVVGVLLKAVVAMVTFYDRTDSSLVMVIAWTLLPLTRQYDSGRGNPIWTSVPSVRGALQYDTLWMDVVTLAVLVVHDRVCIVHGVYASRGEDELDFTSDHLQQQQQQQGRQGGEGSGDGVVDMTVLQHGTTRSGGAGEETAAARSGAGVASPATNIKTASAAAAAHTPHSAPLSPGPLPLPIPPLPPAAAAAAAASAPMPSTQSPNRLRTLVMDYYRNLLLVPGVGEDWYISYTVVDLAALVVVAVLYSRMAGNDKSTLQDNVQNNLLPGPMALLLCVSVLQLVADRMLYVLRSMRLKALANAVCAVVYMLLYWWWRNTVTVSSHAAGNAYFTLKVTALVLSVTQVCRGFPVHRRRDAFTTHPGNLVSYGCFTIFRALPFLWEVRTLVDWTVLPTSLSLQEYLTLEDVYVYMYQCRERYLTKLRGQERLGDAVAPLFKWVFGGSRLALILLALLGPLFYYSTYNPSTVANSATQLTVQLSFFGAHDFFVTTVHDNTTTPDDWWAWVARTRPTLGSYGPMQRGQAVQLMELTSCSSSLWMASPQAVRQVLAGLRAAAANTSAAYMSHTIEVSRSASGTTAAAASLVRRWPIPWDTAHVLVRILEQEANGTNPVARRDSGSSASSGDVVTSATLPHFYSPFLFNRASGLEGLPVDARFPRRNLHNCTLELNHDRDAALNALVRYWCLRCTPLFPSGNIPSASTSSAAEWHCLSTGEGCDAFDYEDGDGRGGGTASAAAVAAAASEQVPLHLVVISDTVVMGISFLKGIGIVAIYTTFVLALGRLLRSVLANQVSTLIFSNMANPAALEKMVRCIGMAREYGDLRLEHAVYLELIDLLRSTERLFRVTGSLRCMYVDAGHDDLFRLGQLRRLGSRRDEGGPAARHNAAEDTRMASSVTPAVPGAAV